MLLSEDAFALSLLFHLNSEPWNNTKAYAMPQAHEQFKTIASSECFLSWLLFREPPSSPLMELDIRAPVVPQLYPWVDSSLPQLAGMFCMQATASLDYGSGPESSSCFGAPCPLPGVFTRWNYT